MTVVVCIRRVPFQDNLILSVAINIGHGGIVGGIGILARVAPSPAIIAWALLRLDGRHLATLGLVELDGDIAHGSILTKRELSLGCASLNLVGSILVQGILVNEERAAIGERRLIELHAVAINIERLTFPVVTQDAPRHEDLAVGLTNSHHAAVQMLPTELGIIIFGLCRKA